MSDPRSLAGIEGLLLECSPVRLLNAEGIPGSLVVTVAVGGPPILAGAAELALDDRTGRCHAAWFADRYDGDFSDDQLDLADRARRGLPFSPEATERLRDLVLLAAGRGDAVASAPTSER